jgi:hypothetical protein
MLVRHVGYWKNEKKLTDIGFNFLSFIRIFGYD